MTNKIFNSMCTKKLDIEYLVILKREFPTDYSSKMKIRTMVDRFNHMPVFSLVKADCCVCVCRSNYSHVIALAVDDREFSLSLSSK